MTDPAALVAVVEEVRAIPYAWPGAPGAAAARSGRAGTCASKHALLGERLADLGVPTRPLLVLGALLPEVLATDPELSEGEGLLEVHECLTATLPGIGPLLLDVTWDPPLVRRGLPGTVPWDGRTDMELAVGAVSRAWAPPTNDLREHKEAVRGRLYDRATRARRDRLLALLSARFAVWRTEATPSPPSGRG